MVRDPDGAEPILFKASTLTWNVFAAGTTDWACAPTGRCADLSVPPAVAGEVGTLTADVLVALDRPRAGLTHPATATVALTPHGLAAALAPAARGTYGGADTDEVARQRGSRLSVAGAGGAPPAGAGRRPPGPAGA